MKTKLLYLLFAVLSISIGNAQTIGLVGTGANGWPGAPLPAPQPDIMLTTTDNINYTIADQIISTGEVKFRQDQAWTTNWGGSTFPNGTATLNGPNIPTVAGTYTINFNIQTGDYSFVGAPAFDNIGVWGPAVDAVNGFLGPDVDMLTTDGINYMLSAFTFSSGVAKFRKNDDNTLNYGSTGFPTGTAVLDGPNFYVPGGEYTVYYNSNTGAYSFEFPSVGYLGTVLNPTGFDGPDVDLITTDGVVYTGTGYLEAGALKFRLDNMWTTNWGGTGMVGTASVNGADIAVDAAGTYDIMFNRQTLEYSITPGLGLSSNSIKLFSVYPNPSNNSWNISSNSSPIQSIAIFDVAGKLVMATEPKANVSIIDATALTNGVYFAKITTIEAEQTIKVVKE